MNRKQRNFENTSFSKLSNDEQQSILNFEKEGFAILKKYINKESIKQINKEIDTVVQTKKIKFKNGAKIMFAHRKTPTLPKIASEKYLTALLSSLLPEKASQITDAVWDTTTKKIG